MSDDALNHDEAFHTDDDATAELFALYEAKAEAHRLAAEQHAACAEAIGHAIDLYEVEITLEIDDEDFPDPADAD